ALYTPEVDAVQEFKVDQNTYDAAIGFSGSTVINVVTKSGTNQFHGDLFEFLQNSALNANDFFKNQNGIGISPSKQNQFGGTLGGPIVKNNTFFFFDYQATITRSSRTEQAGVPSLAERNGDFGEACTRAGGVFDAHGMCSQAAGQIWDPYSGVYNNSLGGAVRSAFVPFDNLATYISPGNPKLAGTPYALAPYAGNLIDPVASKMMQYFPLPNVAVGTPEYNYLDNWIGNGSNRGNDYRLDLKIDHQISDASLLSVRVSHDRNNGESPNCFGNVGDPCTSGPETGYAWSGSVNYNHTFSPTLVLTATYGYARSFSDDAGVAADFPSFNPVTTLGLPSYMLTSGYNAVPAVTLGNGYDAAASQSLGSREYSILHYPLDTHTLHIGLDKVLGNHEFKMGYEGRLYRISFLQVGAPEGDYTFSLSGTSRTPRSGTGGDAMASLLMGFPQGGNGYRIDVAVSTQNFAHAWYFQDNWRPTSRLTVNLGLRYELTLPRTERYNRMSWIDPNVVSPIQVAGLPQLTGGMEFASDKERHAYNTDYADWGPRVGLAYRAFDNIVIRTGYGIFYDPIQGAASGTGGAGFYGFNYTTPLLTTYQSDGATPFGRLSNPFPNGIDLPPGNSQGLLTGVGHGITDPVRYWNQSPYMQTWNFGLQKEFPGSILVDANYVGTKGTHLYFGNGGNLDYLDESVETASPAQIAQLNSHVPNPFYGVITDPTSSLSSPTVRDSQLLLPHPEFTGFSGNDPPWANSIYNALQLRVEKRFSHGLQVLGTYVWSKSIDDASVTCNCTRFLGGGTSLQDPNRRYLERSVSSFDIPQVFQGSYGYQLPFGRGQKGGSNWNGFVDAVLGGWQTNGILRFDDGLPISLGLSNGQSLPTYGSQRPNLIEPLKRNNGPDWMDQYFADPEAAVAPAPFTLGNAPRNIGTVRIPGTATTALSAFKQFHLSAIHEGTLLEFRVEAFNALNHPQFGGPSTTVGASSFGRVTSQVNIPRQVQLGLKLYF
ncbi:MAG: hypothetical protein ACRD4O_08875, partial [Bryobacteraceae bacterium]